MSGDTQLILAVGGLAIFCFLLGYWARSNVNSGQITADEKRMLNLYNKLPNETQRVELMRMAYRLHTLSEQRRRLIMESSSEFMDNQSALGNEIRIQRYEFQVPSQGWRAREDDEVLG